MDSRDSAGRESREEVDFSVFPADGAGVLERAADAALDGAAVALDAVALVAVALAAAEEAGALSESPFAGEAFAEKPFTGAVFGDECFGAEEEEVCDFEAAVFAAALLLPTAFPAALPAVLSAGDIIGFPAAAAFPSLADRD